MCRRDISGWMKTGKVCISPKCHLLHSFTAYSLSDFRIVTEKVVASFVQYVVTSTQEFLDDLKK